jgi:hypothetical protein
MDVLRNYTKQLLGAESPEHDILRSFLQQLKSPESRCDPELGRCTEISPACVSMFTTHQDCEKRSLILPLRSRSMFYGQCQEITFAGRTRPAISQKIASSRAKLSSSSFCSRAICYAVFTSVVVILLAVASLPILTKVGTRDGLSA